MPQRWQNHPWWPSSKMTAVGITGTILTFGIWALKERYGVTLDPVDVAANMTWTLFVIGYAITEQRGRPWN